MITLRDALGVASGITIGIGLMLTVAPFQPYQVDPDGDRTSGWEYTSGADDASIYLGFIIFALGVVLSVLSLVMLLRARQGLAVAVVGVGALSLLVAIADTNAARNENGVAGGSLGRGLALNVGASIAAVLLGVVMIVLTRRRSGGLAPSSPGATSNGR